jgi:hypothetical protein
VASIAASDIGTWEALLMLGIREDRREVLRLGEESDDVDVIRSDEVEPAAGKAGHATEPQTWNTAQFAEAWRACTWHPTDRLERRDGCTEESFTELVTALAPVVAGAVDEVDLGEGT